MGLSVLDIGMSTTNPQSEATTLNGDEVELLNYLFEHAQCGAFFFGELRQGTRLHPVSLTQALKRLMARGYVETLRSAEGEGEGRDLGDIVRHSLSENPNPSVRSMVEQLTIKLERTKTDERKKLYYLTEKGVTACTLIHLIVVGLTTMTTEPRTYTRNM
jgi:hypothetical protein